MKHLTVYILATLFLFGCSGTNSPKSTVANFISTLKMLDFENAQAFVTDETKTAFTEAKLKFQNSSIFQDELTKSKSLNESDIVKKYGLDQLIETVTDKNAVVFSKDSTSKIKLEKVGGSWKIICTKDIVEGILFENRNFEVAMEAYKSLYEQYERRTDLILNIISTTQNADVNAIRQKIKEIESIGNDISNVSTYGSKQNELTNLISNILSTNNPSTDLSIQLEGIENRITLARRNFNDAVVENNSGFGQKINYFPANANVNAVEIKFGKGERTTKGLPQ